MLIKTVEIDKISLVSFLLFTSILLCGAWIGLFFGLLNFGYLEESLSLVFFIGLSAFHFFAGIKQILKVKKMPRPMSHTLLIYHLLSVSTVIFGLQWLYEPRNGIDSVVLSLTPYIFFFPIFNLLLPKFTDKRPLVKPLSNLLLFLYFFSSLFIHYGIFALQGL